MNEEMEDIKGEEAARPHSGGTYLVVADESEEFAVALRYAARLARQRKGTVGILKVIAPGELQMLGDVEARMKRELRQQAEAAIWDVTGRIEELGDLKPTLYIEDGDARDVIPDLMKRDLSIRQLILAGRAGGSEPGPLVHYFTGKGLAKLNVPVKILPGHLEPQQIADLLE